VTVKELRAKLADEDGDAEVVFQNQRDTPFCFTTTEVRDNESEDGHPLVVLSGPGDMIEQK